VLDGLNSNAPASITDPTGTGGPHTSRHGTG